VVGIPWSIVEENVPCRIVPQNHIFQDEFPFYLSIDWITLDRFPLALPVESTNEIGIVYKDYLAAHMVRTQEEPIRSYVVCRREEILEVDTDPYWRYLLIPLLSFADPTWPPRSPLPPAPPPAQYPPVPPPPPPGGGGGAGSSCSTAVVVPYDEQFDFSVSGPVGTERWYVCDALGGYSHVTTNVESLAGLLQFEFALSEDCVGLGWTSVTTNCVTTLVSPPVRLFLRFTKLDADPHAVTLRVSPGQC
jgi:hypothetical protein